MVIKYHDVIPRPPPELEINTYVPTTSTDNTIGTKPTDFPHKKRPPVRRHVCRGRERVMRTPVFSVRETDVRFLPSDSVMSNKRASDRVYTFSSAFLAQECTKMTVSKFAKTAFAGATMPHPTSRGQTPREHWTYVCSLAPFITFRTFKETRVGEKRVMVSTIQSPGLLGKLLCNLTSS